MSDRVLNMPLQLTLDAINFTQEEREPLLKKIDSYLHSYKSNLARVLVVALLKYNLWCLNILVGTHNLMNFIF